MFVGDDEIAIVLILQRQPVFDAADVMAQMQFSGWSISGENPLFGVHRTECTGRGG